MKAKLISESLNFEKKNDPLVSLGVGQKALIEKWLDEMGVTNYTINDDLTIDVKDSVNLDGRLLKNKLTQFPEYIQFNIVYAYFEIQHNNFITLRGCPYIVKGYFSCCDNELYSLEYAPKKCGEFWCINNKIRFTKEYVSSLCDVRNRIVT
jgi:hypothetical protein